MHRERSLNRNQPPRQTRYYIVVSRRRSPICWGFLLALSVVTATISGQQPKQHDPGQRTRKQGKIAPLPQPPLLPLEQAWLVSLPSPPSAGGAIDSERIYVPLQGKQFIALQRETGAVLWTTSMDSTLPPAAGGGSVYVADGSTLQSLDVATGMPRWSADMTGAAMAPGPRLAGNAVIVPVADELFAFRVADGAELWRRPIGGLPGAISLTVGAMAVFIATADSRVVAIALNDGRTLWSQTLAGTLSEPAAGRDRVFVGSTDNFLYALDDRTGAFEWKWRAGGDVIGAVVDDEAVYVASLDNIIRALNRGNGNQRWMKEAGTRPVMPPRIASGAVVVTGVRPSLSAFSVVTGMPMSTYEAPGELAGDPLIDPLLQPFRVATAIVTRDGRAVGLRPAGLLFREPAAVPLPGLPGKLLPRERAR
jgi:outer membrane protein assembly factor BamB